MRIEGHDGTAPVALATLPIPVRLGIGASVRVTHELGADPGTGVFATVSAADGHEVHDCSDADDSDSLVCSF